MPKLFGVAIDKIVHKELSKGLLPGKLYSTTDEGERDPNRLTGGRQGGTGAVHTFRGIEETYTTFEIDGELIRLDDRKFLITALSITPSVIPSVGMLIALDQSPDKLYRVLRVKRDPASATFTCQGR
jgi:hypothetical protein